jgi:hypothetical protein
VVVRSTTFLLVLGLLASTAAGAAEVVSSSALDSVFTHVRGGRVDYRALARDPGPLRRYLAAAAEARPEGFSRAQQMTFWINTYDARVLDGVVRRPGLSSVLDSTRAPGFFTEKRRSGGRDLSLDDIEHRLRELGDPRVHFVLNCASKSCPPLPARALTSAALEAALDHATTAFLADRSKNRWSRDGALEVSAIFDWYRGDFATVGGVQGFVARYWRGTPRPTKETKLRVLPYDWSLNGTW